MWAFSRKEREFVFCGIEYDIEQEREDRKNIFSILKDLLIGQKGR